jgi:hypothetical protein
MMIDDLIGKMMFSLMLVVLVLVVHHYSNDLGICYLAFPWPLPLPLDL